MTLTKSMNGFLALSMVLGIFVCNADAQEGKKKVRGQAIAGKEPPHPPKVGEEAPNFELKTTSNEQVELRKLTGEHSVIVLVLRGWPEYQCPICSRQVGEFLAKRGEIEKLGAHLVMIYPGPAEKLSDHAKEFQGNREFKGNVHYVTDPDYKFTNAWGLRWEAPRETAYPSTFIVGKDNKIKFGVTSTSHGDRANAETVIAELQKLAKP